IATDAGITNSITRSNTYSLFGHDETITMFGGLTTRRCQQNLHAAYSIFQYRVQQTPTPRASTFAVKSLATPPGPSHVSGVGFVYAEGVQYSPGACPVSPFGYQQRRRGGWRL